MKLVLVFAVVLVVLASNDAIPSSVHQLAVDTLGPSYEVVKIEITGTRTIGKDVVNTVIAVGDTINGSSSTTKSCILGIQTDVHGDVKLWGYSCHKKTFSFQ